MEKEVAPVIEEHEREHSFPVEVVRRLGEMGWLGIPIPEDEGGAGMDTLAYAIAVEEIGRVWGSLGLIVAAHTSLGCGPLHLAGTKEQKDRYLVPMASGKVIGAYGLTEPGAGSDAGGTRTTARWEGEAARLAPGGEWVDRRQQALHHQRRPGGHVHHHRPDRHEGRRRRRDLGVHPARRHAGLPRRPDRGQARAPRVGDRRARVRPLPHPGREPARRARRRLPDVPEDPRRRPDQHRRARASGIAQGAYDAAVPYAQTREQFGKPIGSFQGVAFMIADMATEIEAARALVWKSAWLKDQGRDYSLVAAQAKLFASEVSSRVTNAAIQVHGGYGYVTEYPVERYLRDAKLTEIGEGTSQVQRLVIARKILGLRIG